MALVVKNLLANAEDSRDMGSIPGWGRSPGGGHGNPLQYSCLENSLDRGAWWATVNGVTNSCTQLKRLSTHAPYGSMDHGLPRVWHSWNCGNISFRVFSWVWVVRRWLYWRFLPLRKPPYLLEAWVAQPWLVLQALLFLMFSVLCHLFNLINVIMFWLPGAVFIDTGNNPLINSVPKPDRFHENICQLNSSSSSRFPLSKNTSHLYGTFNLEIYNKYLSQMSFKSPYLF